MKPPLHLWGRTGFGDAIYTRAVVHAALRDYDVWLSTAWPQLFADLPVHCVPADTNLRCQRENMAAVAGWETSPVGIESRGMKYRWKTLHKENLLAQMERGARVSCHPFRFDLPPLPASPVSGDYAVIRPVTERTDWANPARNPIPEYVASAAKQLRKMGYTVVSVASVVPGVEDLSGQVDADIRFEAGELSPLELLALIRDAALVVGGVGWIVPACIATATPGIIIGGGRGGCDAPWCLTDSRMSSRLTWLLPVPYCQCTVKRHQCRKVIPNFQQKFVATLETMLPARAA